MVKIITKELVKKNLILRHLNSEWSIKFSLTMIEKWIGFVKLFIGQLGTKILYENFRGDWTGHDYIENNRKSAYTFLSNQLQDNSRIIVWKSLDTGILFALE